MFCGFCSAAGVLLGLFLPFLVQCAFLTPLWPWCFVESPVHSQQLLFSRKLRDVLQQKLIKFFLDQSKKDAEKYAKFFEDYGLFMREGIVTTAEQDIKVG